MQNLIARNLSEDDTKLHLAYDNIGPQGARDLARALPSLTNLTKLYLESNNIGPQGARDLAEAIGCNVSLIYCFVEALHYPLVNRALRGPRPPHHVTVGLTLLHAGARGCGAIRSGKGLTQDERELILRLLEPWFGRYDTDVTRARREKALAQ